MSTRRRQARICSAHRSNGEPCRAYAMQGQKVCKTHGGRAAQNKRAGARRVALGKVAKAVGKLGPKRDDVDPLSELLGAIWLDACMVAVLADEVGKLEVHPATDTEGAELRALYGPNHTDDAVPHVLFEELRKWNDLKARHTKLALDAGVEERRIRIEEREAELLAQIVFAVIDHPDLDLSATQRKTARKVFGVEARSRLKLVS